VVAAPVILPVAATVGGAVAAGAGAIGAAVGSTAVGGAIAGAASTAAAAVGSTAVGGAIAGAASTAAGAVATGLTSTVAVIGAEGVAAAIGAAATYSAATAGEGFMNKAEAEEIIASTRRRYTRKKDELENSISSSNERMMKLNEYKMEIYAGPIKESVDFISKIIVPKEKKMDFTDNKKVVFLPSDVELVKMKKTSDQAVEVMHQIAKGSSFIKAASGGSLAFMSQFGIASTGTAISSLSGAAATNATLAALGGGALSAGGGGMALGSAVLGGVSILPAAMMMSWAFAKESEKALTEAKEYHSKLEKEIGKMETVQVFLEKGLNPRIDEIYSTIQRITVLFEKTVLKDLSEIVQNRADSTGKVLYNNCSSSEQKKIQLAAYFTRKLKDLLAVKPLDKGGKLNEETEKYLEDIKKDNQIQGVVKIV
jgi:hypothetical protein